MKMMRFYCPFSLGIWVLFVLGISGCSQDPVIPIDMAQPSPQSIRREDSNSSMEDLDSPTLISKAVFFKNQGRLNDALFYYVTFLEREPDNANALAAIGQIHLEKRNWLLAKNALEMSLAKEPDQTEVLESLGLIALYQKDFSVAETALLKAKKLNPRSVRALSCLALLEDRRGGYVKAESHYKEALQIDPKNAGLRNNYAYSLYLAGRTEQALDTVNEALRSASTHEGALMNRSLFLMKLGRMEEAMANFRRFLNEADANNNMGFLSMEAGNFDLAKDYLEKAIRSSPAYHDLAHENLKKLAHQKGQIMNPPEKLGWAEFRP